jgi:small subunit ribosomal protein S17
MDIQREKNRRKMVGVVIRDKMDKTVVVQVERFLKHPTYHKYLKLKNTCKAHDEHNTARVGDKVLIVETRPLSKDKRWTIKEILKKEAPVLATE